MPDYLLSTCRGSFALGTACGKCERCQDELVRIGLRNQQQRTPPMSAKPVSIEELKGFIKGVNATQSTNVYIPADIWNRVCEMIDRLEPTKTKTTAENHTHNHYHGSGYFHPWQQTLGGIATAGLATSLDATLSGNQQVGKTSTSTLTTASTSTLGLDIAGATAQRPKTIAELSKQTGFLPVDERDRKPYFHGPEDGPMIGLRIPPGSSHAM